MIDELFDQRGVPVLIVGDDHRIQAANRRCAALFAGEQLLGRTCYEVFHHRKTACTDGARPCPLKHYRESGEPCRVVHLHRTRRGEEHHEVFIHPSRRAGVCACLEIKPVAVASARPSTCRLVGRCPAFTRLLEMLLRAAHRQTPVLVVGEPGTCREKVARALHRLGGKPDGAFLTVHCRGLGGVRFAAELSALKARDSTATARDPGRPGQPHGCTLYLDEVGELGVAEQGQLLRLLKGAGDRRDGTAGLRLVCATRPNLRAKVTRGAFLEDLYYRVSVFPITLPPLRERREDLPLLAECLLRQIGCDPQLEIHPQTLAVLDRYPFPGNLRELRKILEHASLVAAGRQILPKDLPQECRSHATPSS